jgi:hypothetical protein
MEDLALLVMAITEGLGGVDLPGKTKRAAFSGRHVQIIVPASRKLSTRAEPDGCPKSRGKAGRDAYIAEDVDE